MTGVAVGVLTGALVLAAGLVASDGFVGRQRLRRLQAERDGSRGGSSAGAGWPRWPWWPRWRGRASAWLISRRQPHGEDTAARTVSELAALLRAGVAPSRVWEHVVAGRDDEAWTCVLTAAADAGRVGGDIPGTLRSASAVCRRVEEVRAAQSLAAAWEVADRTGAPTAQVLERLADGLRADSDAKGAREAAMAGPRATAQVLSWLPVGGLAIGQLIGADPVRVLVSSPVGRGCAVAGLVLAVIGNRWTHRLVVSAERAA